MKPKKPLNPQIAQIKADMKAKGITQKILSELSGLSMSSISQIFAGITPNPRIGTLDKIKGAVYGSDAEKEFDFPISAEDAVEELKKQGYIEKRDFDSLTDKQKRMIAEIIKNVVKHSE